MNDVSSCNEMGGRAGEDTAELNDGVSKAEVRGRESTASSCQAGRVSVGLGFFFAC